MSTNTKLNPITLILISVVVIFIAAIIYKNISIDNSEVVNVSKETIVKPKVVKDKKEYEFTPSINNSNPLQDKYSHLTKEERDIKISAQLHKYTNYRTPEQVLETVYELKRLGREQEAEEYIDFLIQRFPDYEME